jgi:hypothetical protein
LKILVKLEGDKILANELLKKYVKEDMQDNVGVIGIDKVGWWHIHGDEITPEDDTVIALHPRINLD